MMTVTYIYTDIDISTLCLSLSYHVDQCACICSVCRIASVRMNLFCVGHVIYVGIERPGGTITLSLSLSTYSMVMMESVRLCRLLFAISFSLSEFRCEITFL